MRWWILTKLLWQSFCNIYVIMLYTLNSYKNVCQSYLNKAERKGEKSPPPPRCPLLQTRASAETAIHGNRVVMQEASTMTLNVNSDLCTTSTARCGDTRERHGVRGAHLHPEGPARLFTGGWDPKVEWEWIKDVYGERGPQQREQQVRRGSGLCMGQLNYSFILTTTECSLLCPHKGLKRWRSISSLLMWIWPCEDSSWQSP